MPFPLNATHSTKKVRSSSPSLECDNGVKQRKDTPTDKGNNKENRKRKVQGEKNTSKTKKVKKTPQNKTTTSSDEIQKPPNPKKAEYQASVTAVKEIYSSFSAAGFPSKVPAQPPPPSVQPALSSAQHLANPQHGAPSRITTPTGISCTIQQQNMEHRTTLTTGFPHSEPKQLPPPSVQPALSSAQPLANLQLGAPAPITIPTGVPCTIQQQNMENLATLTAGFPHSEPKQPLLPNVQPTLSSAQLLANLQLGSPAAIPNGCSLHYPTAKHRTSNNAPRNSRNIW